MLKSFCIKTNNKKIIDYLLLLFENSNLKDLYITKSKFKFYNNIILHYKGNNLEKFNEIFSNILSSCIINFYEPFLIKQIINSNYFYFSEIEFQKIYEIAKDYTNDLDLYESSLRINALILACKNYFLDNKNVILDGFVNFRIQEYIKQLDYIVDIAVNKFIIDKEYHEFIELLKSYINSKNCNCELVHIIYKNNEAILLDKFNNTIFLDSNIFENNKYIGDISFSNNDYALNSLLNLLPKKIHIHFVDSFEDEFITTLKLIFGKKISTCTNCNVCKSYRLKENI